MSERLSTIEWTAEKESATNRIGAAAINLMEHHYGDGTADGNGGHEKRLHFHHKYHARMVGEQAARLCVSLGLSETEVKIARTAGYAHDVVQLRGPGPNEALSAAWLEREFDTYRIPELKSAASAAILGTEPIFENGIISQQRAMEIEHSDEMVIKAVASADLSKLHSPEGPLESHRLFAEFEGATTDEAVSLQNFTQHQRKQLDMLENYSYPLSEAEALFATHRPEVINYSQQVLHELERGKFDSFDELVAQDTQFSLSLR